MLPKDAAERLGIAKPTLRKWAAEFSPWLSVEAGQPQAGHDRRYSDSDIALLQRIKSYLAERYSYEQIRERLGEGQQHTEAPRSAPEGERSATAPGEQVLILDERPEMEALRLLLDAQRSTLEAQRATLESQGQLIAQLQQQNEQDKARADQAIADALTALEQARADEARALASLQMMLRKIPRWLRSLLGLGA